MMRPLVAGLGCMLLGLVCGGAAGADASDGSVLLQRIARLQSALQAATERSERLRTAQQLAFALSEASDPDAALRVFPFGPAGAARASRPGLPAGLRCADALDILLERAARHRLLMVNEAHHDARTRLLSLRLLRPLRALGYTHLAVENLKQADVAALQGGALPANTTVFARDPVLVAMIQDAVALGYRLVAYDLSSGPDPVQREAAAATVLGDLLNADPQLRLLVHAGYAHVHETPGQLFKVQPLAVQLRQRTGLDPLTVDQTVLRPDPSGRDSPFYRSLLSQLDATMLRSVDALACVSPAGAWSLDPARYDYSVILPPLPTLAAGERPSWLQLDGRRRQVASPLHCTAQQWPCLLTAVPQKQPDASPVEVCLQREAGDCVSLFLPPGDWQVQSWNAHSELERVRVRVAPPRRSPSRG